MVFERLRNFIKHGDAVCFTEKRSKGQSTRATSRKRIKRNERHDKEYEVEKVLGVIYEEEVLFFIKWKGWPSSTNTWEPFDNLQKCIPLLRSFVSNQEAEQKNALLLLRNELTDPSLLDKKNLEKHWAFSGSLNSCEFDLNMHLIAYLSPNTGNKKKMLLKSVLKKKIKLMLAAKAREDQLLSLNAWTKHVNFIDDKIQITVENDVDLTGLPDNFTYVNEIKYHDNILLPEKNPMYCDCVTCDIKSKCSCGHYGGEFPYDKNRRLRLNIGDPIFECNKLCRCFPDCRNRIIQNKKSHKLCIFRTSNGRGWGVKTHQRIPQRQFICLYIGELITSEEADKRGKVYDLENRTYIFDLDFNSDDSKYSLDAAYYGNVSHFINHSCDPNVAVWAAWWEYLDPDLHMLALFSIKDIEVGEELCFDYMQSFNELQCEINENKDVQQKSSDSNEEINNVSLTSPTKLNQKRMDKGKSGQKQLAKCKCGSKNCRKFLFS